MTEQAPQTTESWATRVGVILAVTGSAVGLGNFLRFPGLASEYNTGAFMIPYIVAFLLLGLPIAWAEWTMGRYGGTRGYNSCPGVFRVIWRNPIAPYFGVLGILIPVIIYMYYVFIEAWCLGYAYYYATGAMDLGADKAAYTDFFHDFVGLKGDGSLFAAKHDSVFIFLVICVVLNFFFVYRGLSKGIELFCLYAMPLLVVCAVIVLVRVLTLGTPNPEYPDQNVYNALGFMWNPDASGPGTKSFYTSITDPEMWMKAAGQIFFSLSVGFGVIITYSSYLKKKDDLALSATTAAAGNQWCEVALGGMMIIPAAFVFLGATQTADARGSTFDLGFMTLPLVFNSMPFGQFFGALFFFLLFLAAMTSSLSMLQPAIAFLEEGLALSRRSSVALLGFITVIGTGVCVYFTKDAMALDTMDFWVGTFCIYVLATFQVILFGWVLGTDRGMKELNQGADMKIPPAWGFVIKYLSPLYLIVVFCFWVAQNIFAEESKRLAQIAENHSAQVAIALIILVAVLFLLLIDVAVKRWNKVHPLEEIEE